jgi:hypothetical protein
MVSLGITSNDDEDDDDDGDIRWDGDEHCSDRLSYNFEFHSIVGLMPL